jgi:hypothetical protein
MGSHARPRYQATRPPALDRLYQEHDATPRTFFRMRVSDRPKPKLTAPTCRFLDASQ